ncbi:MAG: helix-turn-helix transcriptional regulator [Bacteroidota bacterium]
MIKLKREAAGWTQEALADEIKVSRDHLSKVERGITMPSFHLIEKLGPIFNLKGSQLYEEFVMRLKNQDTYEKWVNSRLR